MTTRLKGFTVTLEHDIREDDAEAIRQAILCVRSVVDVAPVQSNPDDYMNRQMVRHEMMGKLIAVVQGK